MPACPTFFSPLQAHPRELLRQGTMAWVGWMRDHVSSLQSFAKDFDAAVVVAAASLRYVDRVLFTDTDTISLTSSCQVLKKGLLIRGQTDFTTETDQLAHFELLLRPVSIGEHNSAAARPSRLPPEIFRRFRDDELLQQVPERPALTILKVLESYGELLAEHEGTFVHHRHGMDFADQWAFMESSAYVASNREAMCLQATEGSNPILRGLSAPLREMNITLNKPFFLFDKCVVRTCCYRLKDEIIFLHRLEGLHTKDVHAVVTETFDLH